MKKKMERKSRPHFWPMQIPLPRAVSRFAVPLLTGCLIIAILFGAIPAAWSGPAGRVYAAQTVAAESPASGAGDDQVSAEQGENKDEPAPAQEPGGESRESPQGQNDGQTESDPQKEQGTEASGQVPDQKQEEAASAAGTEPAEAGREGAEQDPVQEDSGQEKSSGNQAAEDSENAGRDETAASPVSGGRSEDQNPGGRSGDRDPAGTRGEAGTAAHERPAEDAGKDTAEAPAANPANPAAGATLQPVLEAGPLMTAGEFDRAYNSVTSGSRNAGGYVPSKAWISSKDSEINYESLGIGEDVDGHFGHTTPVRIRDENGNELVGVCVVPDDRGLATGSSLPGVKQVTDAVMIKLYYYTMLDKYGENLASSKGFGSRAKKVAIAACHEAMSMRYAELAGISYDRPNLSDGLKSLVKAYRSGASAKALPDMNKVHIYVSGRTKKEGHWIQAYVFGFVEEEEPVGVELKKICSDPDMRLAYSDCYCIDETADGGKVYFNVYTDKACTKKAHVFGDRNMTYELPSVPVGLSGKSGLWNTAVFFCMPGTYYLKEMNTPRGFQPHGEVFGPYTVKEGKGLVIKAVNTPRYAKAGIIKKDAETAKVLAGAKYGLYASIEDARNEETPSGIFTTGKDGRSNLLEVLALKTYYVREISAPEGYKKDTGIYKLNTAQSVTAVVWTELTDKPDQGKVRVRKAPSEPVAGMDTASSLYSLEGAVYTLYDANGREAGKLRTGKNGASAYLTVPCGSYTLKETEASSGFALDQTAYPVKITGGSEITIDSKEPVRKGRIIVRKVSSQEKEEKEPDTLPVSGAVYSLYNSREDAAEGRAAAGTLVIGQDGTSNPVEVLAGKTYYVKETRSPEGYLPDEKIYAARVESLTETVTVRSEDRLIFGGVRICKRDLETGLSKPLGGASLEGTVLRIYNDGDLSVYADGKKVLPGAEAMTLVTGEDGTAQTSERALSYGSYRVEEVLSPEGYTKIGAEPVRFAVTEDGKITDLAASAQTSMKDRVMRGDFSLRKINGYTQKRMAGVTFEVTAYDREGREIEKHRFTTDRNGYFDSSAAWAAEQKETARIWFGNGTKEDHSLGALPYGSYHIEEIEGENNRGMKMFSDDFSIYADGQALTLGNIENTLKPVLETELVDENGDHFADRKGMVTLTDTVTYAGMEDYIGKDVTFHGVIYVKETGKPLQIDQKTIECVQTRRILSHSATVQLRFTFDASKAQGMTLVCYEYASEAVSPEDGSGYHDSTNGGKDIVSHTDLEDESQTIHLVYIETDAEDQLTGMKIGMARDGAVTVDHVTCKGLIPGHNYRVTGFLVDKSTGRPLRDDQGAQITAEASFKAEKTEEVVDLTFTYDASLLEGTTVVAFERLYLGGRTPDQPREETPETPDKPESPDKPGKPDKPDKPEEPTKDRPDPDTPIAVHEDPDDEEQSVHYPRIRTYAEAGLAQAGLSADEREKGGAVSAEMKKTLTAEGRLVVRDHVTWENLIPGTDYSLQGALMDKNSGQPFMTGGKAVTAQAKFTPGTTNGETDLFFSFDATGIFPDREAHTSQDRNKAGTEQVQLLALVAFEELYISQDTIPEGDIPEDKLVAQHKDLQDPAQTLILREPEKPEEPEKPDQPEKPQTPDEPEPSHPHKKSVRPAAPETVRTGTPVKTGDDTNLTLYLLPVLLSAIALAGLLIARRHAGRKKG